jgi:tetratricopeptide (TPR) repeat protein
LAEQVGEQHLHARALNLQGNVTKLLSQFAQATRHYEASLALFRALHEEVSVSMLLNNLATLVQEQGDYARACTLLEESLAIKRRQGDQRGIALVLTNLGDTARKEGHLDEARARTEESLALLEQVGDEKTMASVFHNLGQVALLKGEYAQASTYLQQSLTRAERVGVEWMIAAALHTRGRLAAVRGERAEAERAYQESLQLYRREHSPMGMVECLEGLIALYAILDPARGARLYGLTTAFRARMGTPVPPVDVPPLLQAVVTMRAALGEEAFTSAMTSGGALDLNQGLADLLSSRSLD